MQESSDRKPDIPEPESDSTSKETLKDIEDTEKFSPAKQGGGQESDVPSPDGAFDESEEIKDAGPM